MTATIRSTVTGLTRPDAAPMAVGAVALGALVFTASADDGIAVCPFRRCTGGYCPGCGATRAANRLVHGDVAASWSHHPWVILAAVQVVVLGSALALVRPPRPSALRRRAALPLTVLNAVVLIGIWITRLSAESIPRGWLSAFL